MTISAVESLWALMLGSATVLVGKLVSDKYGLADSLSKQFSELTSGIGASSEPAAAPVAAAPVGAAPVGAAEKQAEVAAQSGGKKREYRQRGCAR